MFLTNWGKEYRSSVEKHWFDRYVKTDKTPIRRGAVKPRLKRSVLGDWQCVGGWVHGFGRTPKEAYQEWVVRWLLMQASRAGAWL